jgi:ribose transport system substrate-binding protein
MEDQMKLKGFTRRWVLSSGAALLAVAAAATNPVFAAEGDAKGKKVEYITFGLQFEYQVAMVEGMKKRAEEAGIILNVIDGKGDPNLQVTQTLDAITKQPDALVINPIDAALLVAGVKRANEANIPVFIMENAPPEGNYLGFVDFDNEAGGAMGADALAELIGGSGVVLETRGSVGSAQAQARHKGFNDRIKEKYPNIEVRSLNTEWVADNAYKMVLDAFTQNPDIKGVFSHNDEMVRGIVSALRQIGKLVPPGEEGHVAVVGLDGTPLALDRIREGTQDATVAQDPYAMGGGGILEQVIAYFEGRDYDNNMQTKPYLINRDNVDEERHWGNLKKTP